MDVIHRCHATAKRPTKLTQQDELELADLALPWGTTRCRPLAASHDAVCVRKTAGTTTLPGPGSSASNGHAPAWWRDEALSKRYVT